MAVAARGKKELTPRRIPPLEATPLRETRFIVLLQEFPLKFQTGRKKTTKKPTTVGSAKKQLVRTGPDAVGGEPVEPSQTVRQTATDTECVSRLRSWCVLLSGLSLSVLPPSGVRMVRGGEQKCSLPEFESPLPPQLLVSGLTECDRQQSHATHRLWANRCGEEMQSRSLPFRGVRGG